MCVWEGGACFPKRIEVRVFSPKYDGEETRKNGTYANLDSLGFAVFALICSNANPGITLTTNPANTGFTGSGFLTHAPPPPPPIFYISFWWLVAIHRSQLPEKIDLQNVFYRRVAVG